jgi:hypothetical protein
MYSKTKKHHIMDEELILLAATDKVLFWIIALIVKYLQH